MPCYAMLCYIYARLVYSGGGGGRGGGEERRVGYDQQSKDPTRRGLGNTQEYAEMRRLLNSRINNLCSEARMDKQTDIHVEWRLIERPSA